MALIAETASKFSIFDLKKWGFITPGTRRGSSKWTYCSQESSISFWVVIDGIDDYIRLMYHTWDRFTGEGKEMDYQVSLCQTPCNYGGRRYWFVCPKCKRRCGTLFFVGKLFLCRKCGRVLYYSQTFKIVSGADLDRAFSEIKRSYYKGKPTRKYRKYLRLERKEGVQSSELLGKWAVKFGMEGYK